MVIYAFQQSKKIKNQLRFDKVTESLKLEIFLRHSVVLSRTITLVHINHYCYTDDSFMLTTEV